MRKSSEKSFENIDFYTPCKYITLGEILRADPKLIREKTAVLAHPFFNLRGNYEEKITRFIREFPSPIIVLSYNIESDLRRISGLSHHKEQFYLSTGYMIALPKVGWDTTAQMINGFYPKEVLLGGANLSYNEDGSPAQCVGFSFRNLKTRVPNIKICQEISNI